MLRVGSAAVLLALVITTIWVLPPAATLVLAAIAAALGAAELAHMASRVGAPVPAGFVAPAAAFVVLALVAGVNWPNGADALAAVLLGLIVAAGAITLAAGPPSPAAVTRAAVTAMAPCYTGLPLGAIAWIQWTAGPGATTWLLAVIALSDTGQYYTGRAFGRRKLAPSVSPAKTVEGAIGGLLVAAIAGAALGSLWLPHVGALVCSLVALILALSGIVGDLFESLLKRSAGVKDSSTLIPGHGGVLDRIDSHLFAAPLFYLFVRYAS